jgi:hypothetical protein
MDRRRKKNNVCYIRKNIKSKTWKHGKLSKLALGLKAKNLKHAYRKI